MLKTWSLLPNFIKRRLLVGEIATLPGGSEVRTLQYLIRSPAEKTLRS